MQGDGGRSSTFGAAGWMVVITLALFFLPLVNGLIGGAVGGYKAGGMKRALAAAVLPAAVVAAGLFSLFVVWQAPAWGVVAGTAAGVLILLADLGIFVGAAIGGYVSEHRRASRPRTV